MPSKLNRCVHNLASARVIASRLTSLGLLCALAGCGMFSGSSAKEALAQVDWGYAEDAVLIEVEAGAQLNYYDGQPHTLLLGVFEMTDADSFRKLASSGAALAQALAGGQADGSVLQLVRYVVQPGRHTILSVNRVAKAKVVGLISGYYEMSPATSARLFEIPLAISDTKLIGHEYFAQPQTLAIKLGLGSQRIDQAQRLNPEPPQIAQAKAKLAAKQVVPLDGGGKEILLTPANGAEAPGAAAIQIPN